MLLVLLEISNREKWSTLTFSKFARCFLLTSSSWKTEGLSLLNSFAMVNGTFIRQKNNQNYDLFY